MMTWVKARPHVMRAVLRMFVEYGNPWPVALWKTLRLCILQHRVAVYYRGRVC